MTEANGLVGRMAVQFVDGSSLAADLVRRDGQLYVTWPQPSGVAFEHPVREGSAGGANAWAREVARVVNKRIRTYDWSPRRR